MATTTTTSKVTRKQVYSVLVQNADALKPLFEGAGVDADAATEVLNKALAAVSKAAPRPEETREFAANKQIAYQFAGTLDPDDFFVPAEILDANPILRSSQKATAVARAGERAGYFESHVLTRKVGGFKKNTRVYRLLSDADTPWGDEAEVAE